MSSKFRGSLPSGGQFAALPSIIRRHSVAMKLLSVRMTALNKDVVTTLIAQHGTISRVGVDYKSPITITITVPIKLSITITIRVVIEKAITITITIIRLRLQLRLQLLVYHGNDSRLFIRHVHLKYYHA